MELYKIEVDGSKVYIKALHYNPNVWAGSQWRYHYVRENHYGTEKCYATDFETIELAQAWIDEHTPQ